MSHDPTPDSDLENDGPSKLRKNERIDRAALRSKRDPLRALAHGVRDIVEFNRPQEERQRCESVDQPMVSSFISRYR